jgi:hypothetical protein
MDLKMYSGPMAKKLKQFNMKKEGCLRIGTMNEFIESAKKEKFSLTDFGKWHVSKNGDMEYDNGRYFIEASRISEDNWILHMLDSKGWIDYNEFIPAYFQALKNINKQFIKIKICY